MLSRQPLIRSGRALEAVRRVDVVPTILVVDYRIEILAVARAILTRHSYCVLTAESGEQALQIIDSEQVDFVLTEILMPGMSGLDLMARVKASHDSVEVLLMTGYTDESLDPDVNILNKPFTAARLLKAVRIALASKNRGSSAAAATA